MWAKGHAGAFPPVFSLLVFLCALLLLQQQPGLCSASSTTTTTTSKMMKASTATRRMGSAAAAAAAAGAGRRSMYRGSASPMLFVPSTTTTYHQRHLSSSSPLLLRKEAAVLLSHTASRRGGSPSFMSSLATAAAALNTESSTPQEYQEEEQQQEEEEGGDSSLSITLSSAAAAAPQQLGGGKKSSRKSKPWQGPYPYHAELDLVVESLTNLGVGICRSQLPEAWLAENAIENGDDSNNEEGRQKEEKDTKWVVMVPGVIPGEKVRVKIWRNHKNYSQADLLQVLEPSPARVTPACPLFGSCGGCQYQHMTVDAQRDWKKQHVTDVLERTGNITGVPIKDVFGTDETLGYRSKITPHHEKPRSGEIRDIGFLRLGSRSLVDVDQCAIATPAINARLTGLRAEVRAAARKLYEEGSPKKAKGATLFLRQTEEGVVTDPREEVSDVVGGLTFKYTAGSFFQNNPHVLPHMVKYVTSKARAPNVRFLVDAYCGGGLFCLSASKDFENCYGVEISELAVLSARRNAELNGITNCHFRGGDATAIFAGISHIQGKETVMIIDPPRKGCDDDFLAQLCSFRPARVVYVSCDPATQARDAQTLMANGYGIEEVQPFDLFPQTRHIENVIVFRDERFSGVGHGPSSVTGQEQEQMQP